MPKNICFIRFNPEYFAADQSSAATEVALTYVGHMGIFKSKGATPLHL
ncbi:hypothetical protein NNRS527_01217 [Nitrosospira sp. NRS527]|nr:hypothetical protein NNRS527_01217 [Nitrosospira sp. NRS527]